MKISITTRFNIGDSVYILTGGEVQHRTIESIIFPNLAIKESTDLKTITPRYKTKDSGFLYYESQLFKTKQELANHILSA